ncbi:carbon-monoxide dehydrogenase large subunit [Roseinatronobacter thiooxidans]|uniref:Carbon-monoxide dehydrogenase large subunit n=1 Tax=Roseinatronobacter thiooxidans TaxID=121821 RepID=A0A2W7PN78_9RHOB|nr:xanthine dehydrogenase family protein molybdopterin-binding subunit [Roseinatronobacter thiooxidans]PZX36753.1 carbon-monoxide dehydrogenase large subunit [Roseinatronobacter thiooxidans]
MNLRALTGAGCYTADVVLDGVLHVAFLRADHAHAEIASLDIADAATIPGVVAVLTGAEIYAPQSFRAVLMQPTADGRPLIVPHRPVLATGRVRHVGELVAMVVAQTPSAAQDGVEAISVDWAPLPVVTSGAPDSAAAIHSEAPDNCAARVALGNEAQVMSAFAAAARIVEAQVDLPRVAPIPLEPRAVLARWDGAAFDVWTAFQGGADLRRELCALLDLPVEGLRLHAAEVGGAFGARGAAYPEHVALLLASRLLDRPLRWQGTRSEMFLSEYPGRGMHMTGRLALDDAGRFTAIDICASADLGAYVHPVGAHISVFNPLMSATGAYAIPAARMQVHLHFSNTVPLGPFRGAGRPDIALLVERLVDEAARATGEDAVSLRRRNMLLVNDFPYKTPLGAVYDSGNFGIMLDRAVRMAELEDHPARVAAAEAAGRIPGLGVALFVEVAGGGALPADEVALTLSMRDGAPHVTIQTVTKDTGQGHAAAFVPLVASRLGVPETSVALIESPPHSVLEGLGSFASRTSAAIAEAVSLGLDSLCTDLVSAVAQETGHPPEDLTCDPQSIRHRDGHVICSLGEALENAAQREFRVIGRAPVGRTFPSGCHIAEVEIDPETGVLQIMRYIAVDDAGHVLSEPHLKGQIVGGIVQGIGNALSERLVTDSNGQMLNASLMDYALPRASDIPQVIVATIECPSPTNTLGVKGAGEAGTTGAIAALGNAVADALARRGHAPVDMPFSPCRLWSALNDGKSP